MTVHFDPNAARTALQRVAAIIYIVLQVLILIERLTKESQE